MESNSRLDELFKSVNLREVISAETEKRVDNVIDVISPIVSNNQDFHEDETEEEIEIVEPYDAEKNARSLVYGLQSIDTIILNPIGYVKTRHSAGGGKAIKKMRAAYQKQMNGDELTETDQRLLKAFETYKRDMELLSDDLIPHPKQTEELIKRAIPYCEETQMNFSAGMGFWAAYAGGLVEKISKILLK